MYLRQLQYLIALARHRHFGRAAEECKISQPALSQALRHLERNFSVPIVDRRSQGFEGFTPQGGRILEWARGVLSSLERLNQELSQDSESISGHIRLGVIPVAMPGISIVTTAFNKLFPNISVSVMSLNFQDLKTGLENFEVDVGINYIDLGETTGLRRYFMYEESYYLIAPSDHPIAANDTATWSDAGRLPLCMLTPDMLNRRILDQIFSDVGAVPRTIIETNCALALCSHVRPGHWFAVVPNTFFLMVGDWSRTRAVRLVEPAVTNAVGMMIVERDPLAPAIHAFLEVAQSISMMDELMSYAPPNVLASLEAAE